MLNLRKKYNTFIFSILTVLLFASFNICVATAIPTSEPNVGKGLVTCGLEDSSGKITNPCDFNDIFDLLNRLMNYALWLVTSVIVGVVVFAGYKYITSRGDPTKVKDTNRMFRMIVLGMFWMLCSWLLVKYISTTFLNDGYDTFLTK